MASAALPIQPVQAWTDSTGALHPTKDAALTVELERALGRIGQGEASIAPGIAKMLVEKRDTIIPLLAAFGPLPTEGQANDGI
jgi:hypothetical protein